MKLIKPSWDIIEQENTLLGIYKHIEKAGRTCYKSENLITDDSAKKFVDKLIESKHHAMIEHGTIYLSIPIKLGNQPIIEKYYNNPYSKVARDTRVHNYCVTTNLRVIIENNWVEDLQYLCEPTEKHFKRVTVKFTLDQGVMREFTRHRVMSFACESTRYCNYNYDKFGNEVTFIIPNWCENIKEGSYQEKDLNFEVDTKYTTNEQILLNTLFRAETAYIGLSVIWKPQQVRNILPLATKCDLIMTGFTSDWKHFFSLRTSIIAETGKPHPQASELADPLYNEFIMRGYIEPLV